MEIDRSFNGPNVSDRDSGVYRGSHLPIRSQEYLAPQAAAGIGFGARRWHGTGTPYRFRETERRRSFALLGFGFGGAYKKEDGS